MRLFVAIDPPQTAIDHLAPALHRKGRDLRWMPSAQWHLTLAFYGEVKPAVASELEAGLAQAAARTATFDLRIKGAGCFPRQPNAAKVLWAGFDGDLDALDVLAGRCVSIGRRAGLTMEKRKFKPHVTLARTKQTADVSGRLADLWDYAGPVWTASSIRLVHSTLGTEVRHETLAEMALQSDS